MAIAVVTSSQQICDSNGLPISGGTVTVYDAGTTTLRLCYLTTDLVTTPATNPIPLDSSGRHTQGMVYITPVAYKILVKNSAGVTVFTRDNIDPGIPVGTGVLAIANGGTGATTAVAAIAALGAADAAQVASLAAQVASLAGASSSVAQTHIATGTTAQRSSTPIEGDIRRNTTTTKWEAYVAAWWNFFTTQDVAAQSDQETATSLVTVVTPGRQQYHPSAAKGWGSATIAATVLTNGLNNNGSFARNSTGVYTFTFSTALSSTTYAVSVGVVSAGGVRFIAYGTKATGSVKVNTFDIAGSAADADEISIIVMGDMP